MDIDKQVFTDLYEVIRSQHKVIRFLVANDQALVEILSNEAALTKFDERFAAKQAYVLTHPKGPVAEALALLQDKLDAVGARLKADIGGWEN